MNTVNCFLIKGEENVLVDCGEDSDESMAALKEGLRTEGLSIADIDRVIITHAHVDHLGMARRVSRAADCEVWVSDLVEDWVQDVEGMWQQRSDIMQSSIGMFLDKEMSSGIYAMFADMSKKILEQWHPVDSDRIQVFHHGTGTIKMGGADWNVVYAPGHSITQSCFYNPITHQLISADMLLKITPTPVMEVDPDDHSQRERSIVTMLDSYSKFRDLETSMVYPGHYENFDDPIDKIDYQVGRIHLRKEECFELIKNGTTDLLQIFQVMYKGRWHLPAFNMTIAYLDLLEHEEKISIVKNEDEMAQIILL